jgi:tRNA-dihydrouridine synthase
LAVEIIQAAKEGVGDLPVSVKTRIGVSKIMIDEWFPVLAKAELAAITVHLRTVKEMSEVPAHWELMKQVRETILSAARNPSIIILGNGDIKSVAEAEDKVKETEIDGVMIGRGIFGNPWLFSGRRNAELGSASYVRDPELNSGLQISIADRLKAMIEHTKLFEEKFAGIKNFEIMKKHYKAYVNGFDGAKELRTKLMEEAKIAVDVERLVQEYLKERVKITSS